jgi:hypothetical protein
MGTCSGPTTIEGQDPTATPTITSTGIAVSLAGATFYADSACAFPIEAALIGAGTTTTTFYYIASDATPTFTATSLGFTTATQVAN